MKKTLHNPISKKDKLKAWEDKLVTWAIKWSEKKYPRVIGEIICLILRLVWAIKRIIDVF